MILGSYGEGIVNALQETLEWICVLDWWRIVGVGVVLDNVGPRRAFLLVLFYLYSSFSAQRVCFLT